MLDLDHRPARLGELVQGTRHELRSLANLPDSFVRAEARSLYHANVLYHGTTTTAKDDIREHGFTRDGKTAGVSTAAKTLSSRQQSSHYFTIGAERAKRFARRIARQNGEDPVLVRVLGRQTLPLRPNLMNIKRDNTTAMQYPVECGEDIAASRVLGSKADGPQETSGQPTAAQHFQWLLHHSSAIHASVDEAAELLHAAQSDSDDDFPAPGRSR